MLHRCNSLRRPTGTQRGKMVDSNHVDRRLFLKRSATVAWATPTILTLMATSAAATNHCVPAGAKCGNLDPLGSGLCDTAGFVPCCQEAGALNCAPLGGLAPLDCTCQA